MSLLSAFEAKIFMKTGMVILLMANTAIADVVADYVYVNLPTGLHQGAAETWRDGLSSKYGVSSGMRLQQVYSAELLKTIAPRGGWIDYISFRADKFWSGNIERPAKGIQIFMGQTSADPLSLNSVFARNITKTMQEVRTVDYSSQLSVASDGRQRLGPSVTLPFDKPFFYDPNQGNLILDMIPVSGFGLMLDYEVDSDPLGKGEFGSVFADFGSAGYPDSGVVSAGGFVTSFRFNQIPEPGVAGLAALGGAALLAASALRKQTQG